LVEAKGLRDAIEELLNEGWNPETKHTEQPVLTLLECLEEIIELRRKTLRPESTRTYIDVFKVFKVWMIKNGLEYIYPENFTQNMARRYLDEKLRAGYGGATHNKHLSMMITLTNIIKDRGQLKINVWLGIKQQKRDIGKNIAFTGNERVLLAALIKEKDLNLYRFIQFMYYGLLRRTEILRLKVQDIRLDERVIMVAYGNAKNRRQESVSVTEAFAEELRSMELEQYPGDYYIFSYGLKPGQRLIKKADRITDKHRKYLRELGIPQNKTIYSWKHTGVIELYNEILDPYAVMRQLRHSDLQTTMIYLKSLGLQENKPVLNAKMRI
jgi:integrase